MSGLNVLVMLAFPKLNLVGIFASELKNTL